jgi:hypothetical protein
MYKQKPKLYIYNHLRWTTKYHPRSVTSLGMKNSREAESDGVG